MLLATLLSAALSAATFTPGSATDALFAEIHIGRAQARAIALQRCRGAVISDSLGRVGARWVYNFEIRPILPGRNHHEVHVDASDGTIVGHLLVARR